MSVTDMGSRLGGRYVVGASLGRGASAEVHEAWDEQLQRSVAIKLLHPEADTHWSGERFCEEARTAARLSSHHVVTVHDFDSGDHPYLVLERMSGRTFADELRDGAHSTLGRVDDRRTCQVLCAVLDALAEARSLGIVHRDVKPGNVMLTDDGLPKLGDFGIAKSAGGDALTRTGEVLGSFAYVAPERASGESATPASDIWSVGIMAYEAFTGVRPFTGDSPATVVNAVLRGDFVPIDDVRPDLPAGIRQAVTASLSPDPASRPTPEAFAEALSGTSTLTMAAGVPVALGSVPGVGQAPTSENHAGGSPVEVTASLGSAEAPITALPLPWHSTAARKAAGLACGAVALLLVMALSSQEGPPPEPVSTPAVTSPVTPSATPSAIKSSAKPASSSTTTEQQANEEAPAATDAGKPNENANDHSTRVPGKNKGHGKGGDKG